MMPAGKALMTPPGHDPGSVVGYRRSADGMAGEDAIRVLEKFGAHRIVSGAIRADLDRVVDGLAQGDVLVVPSLDHLAVSMWRVFDMLDELDRRGISFVSIGEGVDTRVRSVREALDMMRSVLAAERRLVARRSAEGRSEPPVPANDPLLERSRRVAAPWIDVVRENRPRLTWEQLVERIARQGRDVSPLTASLMRRHVRRLVAAGDLPESVLERSQRVHEKSVVEAACRAREIASSDPGLSLREIGARLEAEGIMPVRAEAWSAQTVKRLLED